MFNKQDVYEKEVLPLLKRIRAICEEHGMSFSHTCTVEGNADGTAVSKGILGNFDPSNTDPYTRLNILAHNMSPELVEMLCVRLMAEAAVVELIYNKTQEETDAETDDNDEDFKLDEELFKRIEELFGKK